uniref:KH domain-containing protein n=1 Tax=Panagrellus redivivus TaxID=6233 RepID=A0A7E4UPH0_PANRE
MLCSDTPSSDVITARSPTITTGSSSYEDLSMPTTPTASVSAAVAAVNHQQTRNPAAGDDTTATGSPKQHTAPRVVLRRRRGGANVGTRPTTPAAPMTTTTTTVSAAQIPRAGTTTPRGASTRRIGGQTGFPHSLMMTQHLLPKPPRIDFPAEDVDLLMYSAKEVCALIESERYECSAPFLAQLHALSHRMALLANNIAQATRTSGGRAGIAYSPPKLMTPSVYESFFAERQAGSSTLPESGTPVTASPSQKTIKRLKIEVPEHPNYNFIGRILGPRGISVRQLEAATGCGVLIRGKGSVKNAEREERLRSRNTPGFEHLKEPLHVLLTAEGNDEADCERKLEVCKRRIDKLLKPEYDEFKRHQLAQLAMINGTYTPP